MLRCIVAGMIPILMSEKYSGLHENILANSRSYFDSILKSESYYILRYLPPDILKEFAQSHIIEVLKKQRKTGLWKIKDAHRITYDIYAALKRMRILTETLNSGLIKYDTLSCIIGNYDYNSLLIKKNIFNTLTEEDSKIISNYINKISARKESNGSWGNTVIETSVYLEKLTELGLISDNKVVSLGCDYLFSNLNPELPAHHVGKPYGFKTDYMFSGKDRGREFEAAKKLKPEWMPRAVCFHHVGVIQNSVALMTMLRLGFEKDDFIMRAIDNLYNIYSQYKGFCDSDIKKKYVSDNKIRL